MSTTAKADILLKLRSDYAELQKTTAALRETKTSLGDLVKVGAGAGVAFGAISASLSGMQAALKSFVVDGVKFNATLQTAQIGVASVLKQFDPQKYSNFNDAIRDAGKVIEQLKTEAATTSATFEELLVAYQGTAGAMAAAGVPLDKQVKLIANLSQAMSALGIRTEEMRQEATALLTANITQDARLAKTLGITNEQLNTARERGQLYDFLSLRLAAFAEAGKIAADTVAVLESNLKDAKTQVAAEETQALTAAYADLLRALTGLVRSDVFRTLLAGLAEGAKDAANMVTSAANYVSTRVPVNADTGAERAGVEAGSINTRLRSLASDAERAQALADVRQRIADLEAELNEQAYLDADRRTPQTGAEMDRNAYAVTMLERLQKARAFLEGQRVAGVVAENATKAAAEAQAEAQRKALAAAEAITRELEKQAPEVEKKLAASRYDLATDEQRLNILNNQQEAAIALYEKQAEAARLTKDDVAANRAEMALSLALLDIEERRRKVRKSIADESAKAAKEAAEAAARGDERALTAQLDAINAARAKAEANPYLTNAERRAQAVLYLQQERAALDAVIERLRERLALEADPAAREAVAQRLDAYERQARQAEVGIVAASQDPARGLARFNTQVRQMGEDLDAAFTIADAGFRGMQQGIVDALQSAKSLGDGFKKVFASIGNAILQAIQQLIAMRIATSIFSFLGLGASVAGGLGAGAAGAGATGTTYSAGGASFTTAAPISGTTASFASGGYTGAGGKFDPAGIVHRGEYVMPQEAVNAIGVRALDAVRVSRSLPGYADGGLVGGGPLGARGPAEPPVVNHFHFEAGVTKQELAAVIPMIERRVTAAVEDQRRRKKT